MFAYGSLMFEPELPEAVIERVPARLPGWRRTFNKISLRRATPRDQSFDAFEDVPREFRRGDRNLSLALGTEPAAPDDAIVGELQVYPGAVREELLRLLDRREGFDAARPMVENGYRRAEVEVVRDNGAQAKAITYLTNDTPGCALVVGEECDLATRARILVNATPRASQSGEGAIARGLEYLEGCRASLRAVGIVDPALEELAGAIRARPGAWVERVWPPEAGEPGEWNVGR